MVLRAIDNETCRAFEEIEGPGDKVLLRFIVGEDTTPQPMSADEIETELSDPFATLLLGRGVFPENADELLDGINTAVPDGDPLRTERTFMLGEDSQLGLQAGEIASTNRSIRFLVARGGEPHGPELVISASHPGQGLVEVMAWDVKHQGFNYYRTLRGGGGWVWAGNSRHALQAPTRGKGPFESHPSGNLIMKELKFPWLHWDSFKVHISPEVFAPEDIRRNHRWFKNLQGAQICETAVVMPSIVRWTNTRFEGMAPRVPELDPVRLTEHIVTCPTVNLITSSTESAAARLGSPIDLPPSFFVDVDSLSAVGLPAPPPISVPSPLYLASLDALGFQLTDGDFSLPGDTHFAFVVPERAFEDTEVVRQAVARGVISRRLAATLLMIDFPNPVFSRKRGQLLQHVPDGVDTSTNDLSETIAQSIVSASQAASADSPERDFAQRWSLGDAGWESSYREELDTYYSRIEARVGTQDGFNDYVRLAESRRNMFRELPLFEFPLLFPETNLPEERLEMGPDGSVQAVP